MTTEELHPVVELFLRRAASNPEEIARGRWDWVLKSILENGSQAEQDAVQPIYKKTKLDETHRKMMQELLNPEPEQEDLFSPSGYAQKTQHQIPRSTKAIYKKY